MKSNQELCFGMNARTIILIGIQNENEYLFVSGVETRISKIYLDNDKIWSLQNHLDADKDNEYLIHLVQDNGYAEIITIKIK